MDKKALVIRLSSLGDVALASCVIDPLISKGYQVSFLTYKPYDELFKDDHRVKAIGIKKGELWSALKDLGDFDLYVDLQKNLKTFYMRFKLGGNWVSYDKQSIRRRLSVYFKSLRRKYSIVDAYLEAIGESNKRPKLLVSDERLQRWEETLGKDYVCIGPGARYKKKRYPHYRELAKLLIDKGYRVVIVGDKKDKEETKDYPGVNLCGDISLTDVLAVLKLSKVFVGNDSGLLHMARSVGTKCVQIYGGTHPTLGFSLFEDEGFVLFKNLECQPCHIHGRGHCKFGDYRCLDFSVDYVFSYIERLSKENLNP